jgi:hypothetical protein
MLVYPWGSCGNTACCLFAYLLVCVSQAGLELVSGGGGALLFSQCNLAWKSLYRLGVQGVRVLLLLGVFFLPSVLQRLSKIFDLRNSRCLLPPCSHHLGSFLNVVLTCISFMAKDIEHFFVCLLAFVVLLRIVCSVYLLICSVSCQFWEVSFLNSLYILVINPSSNT